jgi:hypothetical protein
MFHALFLAGGISWCITYLLIIRVSARDRVYGMPLLAVAWNLSWTFVFSFIHSYPDGMRPAVIALFCLNLVIAYQTIAYGPAQFPALCRGLFYVIFAVSLGIALPTVLAVNGAFHDSWGVHAAYLDNLAFSAMFPAMLYARQSTKGQSVGIAVGKLAGTGLISLAFVLYPPMIAGSALIRTMCVSCFIIDAGYLVALYRVRAAEKTQIMPGLAGSVRTTQPVA